MKRFAWALILVLAASPAWCAKKITVGQLEDLLRSLQQDKKTDADVATALKQVELTEELTRTAKNTLMRFVPGPLSTEQIFVLEARSADFIPPASDLPATPTPDAAAQQAILSKAGSYVTGTYQNLPTLTATRTTLRFQDEVDAVSSASGIQGGASESVTSSSFSNPAAFVHFINSTESRVVSEHGAEKPPAEKDKTPWGANKMIVLQEPPPSLGAIFNEAQAAGSIRWLRWELVNGRQAAVYSFAMPKEKSELTVNICCFPDIKQAGVATFYTAMSSSALGGGGGGGGGGVAGNFQTSTDWHNYQTTAPYHGEFFIDPETGIIVRMIVEPELKPTEVVHQQDVRIDYSPVMIGGKAHVLPVKSYINTEVVPKGDSGAGKYGTRRTLFISEFRGYTAEK